ncbi:MAG: tetratricopeptide repeat protein [Deltaproteobacteria bacterium]|nr:tetratricopeptide repeat protein [Deltaproteobacteria bacterium]
MTDEAIKEFIAAIEINPDLAAAHNNLAIAYEQKGWLDKAIKEYQLGKEAATKTLQ